MQLHETITTRIDASTSLNDALITIKAGETYEFNAAGVWKDWMISCDADGYSNAYMSLFNRWKRAKNHPWFALIGTFNQKNYFLIGSHAKITFTHEGRLFCFANDVAGFYWNNKGCLQLTISRVG